MDFLEEGSAGNLIVFQLIHSAHSIYLTVNQLLQNASEAIKMLLIARNAPTKLSGIKINKKFGTSKSENKTGPKKASFYTPKSNRKPSAMENFHTAVYGKRRTKHCILCE